MSIVDFSSIKSKVAEERQLHNCDEISHFS